MENESLGKLSVRALRPEQVGRAGAKKFAVHSPGAVIYRGGCRDRARR